MSNDNQASQNDNPHQSQIFKEFNKALNSHGYSFHQAVIDEMRRLYDETNSRGYPKSLWYVQASEIPFTLSNLSGKIDFLASWFPRQGSSGIPRFMIAECKRVNPSFANWCFAPAPFVHANYSEGFISVEKLFQPDLYASNFITGGENGILARYRKAYQIALEIKNPANVKGDAQPVGGNRPQSIEEAAGQVCRGMSGVIETVDKNDTLLASRKGAYFLPVIFTTANLWTTQDDLRQADITTGDIQLDPQKFKSEDFVLFDYAMSPGLKHSLKTRLFPSTFAEIVGSQYIRTIPVVNAKGIASFLEWTSSLDFPS